MKLSYLNEYTIPRGASLTPERDAQIQNIRAKVLKPMADEETDIAMQIVRDFREWSGGYKPSSQDEIQTYIATSCPFDIDEPKLWAFLTDWMETEGD